MLESSTGKVTEMTPEEQLLQLVFGERTTEERMLDIELAINRVIIALHTKRITKSIAMDAVEELHTVKQTLRKLNAGKAISE